MMYGRMSGSRVKENERAKTTEKNNGDEVGVHR